MIARHIRTQNRRPGQRSFTGSAEGLSSCAGGSQESARVNAPRGLITPAISRHTGPDVLHARRSERHQCAAASCGAGPALLRCDERFAVHRCISGCGAMHQAVKPCPIASRWPHSIHSAGVSEASWRLEVILSHYLKASRFQRGSTTA